MRIRERDENGNLSQMAIDSIVRVYAEKIFNEEITIDLVPTEYREKVNKLLAIYIQEEINNDL
jgi:hypothetical protein